MLVGAEPDSSSKPHSPSVVHPAVFDPDVHVRLHEYASALISGIYHGLCKHLQGVDGLLPFNSVQFLNIIIIYLKVNVQACYLQMWQLLNGVQDSAEDQRQC